MFERVGKGTPKPKQRKSDKSLDIERERVVEREKKYNEGLAPKGPAQGDKHSSENDKSSHNPPTPPKSYPRFSESKGKKNHLREDNQSQ